MRQTVRILGVNENLAEMPPSDLSTTEVWPANDHKGYLQKLPRIIKEEEWTRWFNLHSRAHMEKTYKRTFVHQLTANGSKPFYMQKFYPDVPGCIEFPRDFIQNYFATDKGPNRYFTCTVAWLLAFAILYKPQKIELWGFALRDKPSKPHECYKFERPCFFYWIQQARTRGIDVWYQKEIEALPFEPGDPNSYEGELYGYETKPELALV